MRCSAAKLMLVAAVLAAVVLPQAVEAQEEGQGRGPRFLLASLGQAEPVRVDVKSVPALRRSLSLQLEHVSLGEALAAISQQAGLNLVYAEDGVVPSGLPVTLRADGITVAAALTHVLLDTRVDVIFTQDGVITLIRQPPLKPLVIVGSIAGTVTKAGTAEPVPSASVIVEGTRYGALTDATGRYRIAGVPAGRYTIRAVALGYENAVQDVEVTEGGTGTVNFSLRISAIPLDRVVATGTAFATSMRTVPNPINIITAAMIEDKGSSNITDLLRGEIPGVMPLSSGQNDYLSKIYVRGNAGGGSQDLIKIYIDGVEVAHSEYLSTIDPKSIERIEVVRGPQASAIYGSEASSGVLQIFTKKGHPGQGRPRIELQASAGVVESEHRPSGGGTPLTQDHAVSVSGGGEAFSYRAGASYLTVGEWIKNYNSETLSLSGGVRVVQGGLTAELSALWSDRDYDFANTPIYLRWPQSPVCPQCGNPDFIDNRSFALSQNTMGLKLGYQATPRWQHTLILGDDQNRYAYHQPAASRNTPADTFTALNNHEYRRRSARYHTAYDTDLASGLTARLTGGLDYWSYDVQGSSATNLLNSFGTVRTSSRTTSSFSNDGWWNAGYFGMAEIGVRDQLFITLATRVEHNPNLGEDYGQAVSPRIGASYVRALGAAEIKLRAQWGKGVRPPSPAARTGRIASATLAYIPNPAIAPEEKAGWDAGVELYWGDKAALSLTRYDERAKNLIQEVPIDLTVVPRRYQLQNIGVVDIKGWEAEASLILGQVTLKANYAYSDNVIQEVTEAVAANPNATLQVGDRTFDAPKHSGGGQVTAQVGRGSISLGGSVMSGWRNVDFIAYLGFLLAGETFRGSLRDYYVEYPSLWKWNLRTEQALSDRWTAFVRVDNLWNQQGGDLYNVVVTPGRTTVVGMSRVF